MNRFNEFSQFHKALQKEGIKPTEAVNIFLCLSSAFISLIVLTPSAPLCPPAHRFLTSSFTSSLSLFLSFSYSLLPTVSHHQLQHALAWTGVIRQQFHHGSEAERTCHSLRIVLEVNGVVSNAQCGEDTTTAASIGYFVSGKHSLCS